MTLLAVEAALARTLAAVPEPLPETVPIGGAEGRVLIEPVVATRDQPPFDASSMDGFAVRAAETAGGRSLRLIGTAQAGERFTGSLPSGSAVRIFTGAPVPPGADAVIMQEDATLEGNVVRFTRAARPGESIRPAGNDFHAGQVLLPAGARLTPQALVAAAAANRSKLVVSRRPRIAVLANGDELVVPGGTLGPDQIVSANSVGLLALFAPYGESVIDLGIAADRPEAIREALGYALAGGADVIVTSGGASVGARDYLRDVLLELGVELQFWKIAMRPGRPMMFGRLGRTLIFGLPGNPVSAMVTAEILVKPALRAWLGLPHPEGVVWRLPLAAPMGPNGPRQHYLRGVLETSGQTRVRPFGETDSAHTSSLAAADALIVQAPNDTGQPAGALVDVIALNRF